MNPPLLPVHRDTNKDETAKSFQSNGGESSKQPAANDMYGTTDQTPPIRERRTLMKRRQRVSIITGISFGLYLDFEEWKVNLYEIYETICCTFRSNTRNYAVFFQRFRFAHAFCHGC